MDGKYVVFFVVGVLIGAGITWGSVRAMSPRATPTTPKESLEMPKEVAPPQTPEAPTPTAKPEPKGAADELKACQATLGKIKGAYTGALQDKKNNEEIIELLEELVQKSGADSPEGRPMEWPVALELDEAYTPEGFGAALDKLKAACPDQFPAGAKVDCSEFPCAIHQVVDESGGGWDHKSCPAFKDVFGSGTMTWGSGGDDKQHMMHVVPVPEGPEARKFLEEHEGNLRKRSRQRFKEYQQEIVQENFTQPCKDGDGDACVKVARAYRGEPEEQDFMRQGCEHGAGSACNNLAWQACHDRGECDDEALENARRATELKPEDGQGAWDTYAYVLCKRGETDAANAAYKKSCDAGYAKNCGKTCP